VPGSLTQYFNGVDYLLCLPMLLLTLFALGILLIDLMLPPEWKWSNAVTALVGVGFAAYGVHDIQRWFNSQGQLMGRLGFMGTLIVDGVAVFLF